MFRAYDKTTGKVIAEIELPATVTGAPMTYMHNGRQYIVIAVSTQQQPAELVALSLPDPSRPRPAAPAPAAAPAPRAGPAFTLGPEELAAGRQVYARACAACHGLRGEGREGQAPAVADFTDFQGALRIVQQGGVEMPSMRNTLDPGRDERGQPLRGGRRPEHPAMTPLRSEPEPVALLAAHRQVDGEQPPLALDAHLDARASTSWAQ